MFRVSTTPDLSCLLDDLTVRDLAAVARHLGVPVATLRRWQKTGDAPRSVLLALFYESRWGQSQLHTEAFNARTVAVQRATALADANQVLRQRLAYVEGLGTHGAANDPIQRPEHRTAAAQELYAGPHGRRQLVGTAMAARRYFFEA